VVLRIFRVWSNTEKRVESRQKAAHLKLGFVPQPRGARATGMSFAYDSKQPDHELENSSFTFDIGQILRSTGLSKSTLTFKPKQNIFTQGSPAEAIFYIKTGKVRLTVVSEHGREGVIAILGPSFFFGEHCLANPAINTASATAMVKTIVVRIDKNAMLRALHEEPSLSDMFMSFLVYRNKQIEADLLDHLFNSSEQRLAKILLQLAHLEGEGQSHSVIPRISQDILAARVGTTRSRVNYFMNKFRKLGYINYAPGSGGERPGVKISTSLMNVILKE
jgi:CRP/FNR family transcriptional regulator, cyclic AMP receptor protein